VRLMNPLIISELIRDARDPRSYALRVVFIALSSILFFIYAAQTVQNPADTGRMLFIVLTYCLFLLMLFFMPSLVCTSIQNERQNGGFALLRLTRLSEVDIIWGKVAAAGFPVFLYCLSALPLVAACTIFGGVSLFQVVAVYMQILPTIFLLGALAALAGVLFRSVHTASLITYVFFGIYQVVMIFLSVFPMIITGKFGSFCSTLFSVEQIINDFGSSYGEWVICPFITAAATTLVVFIAGKRLKHTELVPSTREDSFAPRPLPVGRAQLQPKYVLPVSRQSASDLKPTKEKVQSKETSKEKSKAKGKDSRFRRPERVSIDLATRGKRLANDPVSWREMYLLSGFRKLHSLPRFVSIALGMFIVMALMLGTLMCMGAPVLPLIVIALSALAAVRSTFDERQNRTLYLLLATPYNSRKILSRKMLGVWKANWIYFIYILLMMIVYNLFFPKMVISGNYDGLYGIWGVPFLALTIIQAFMLYFWIMVWGSYAGLTCRRYRDALTRSVIMAFSGTGFFVLLQYVLLLYIQEYNTGGRSKLVIQDFHLLMVCLFWSIALTAIFLILYCLFCFFSYRLIHYSTKPIR
jgi:hypothetical protein